MIEGKHTEYNQAEKAFMSTLQAQMLSMDPEKLGEELMDPDSVITGFVKALCDGAKSTRSETAQFA